MRATLSVVIITGNEEANIRKCLEGIKWADEIVIVDNMSSDDTVAICREYTDKIYSKKMDGFGAQKQYAIDKASCDWILSLDADEEISQELKDRIISILDNPSSYEGYSIWRKSFYLGVWIRRCGWYSPVVRLFRRGSGRTDMKYVHEEILVSGRLGEIKSPIMHYSYKSIAQHVTKLGLYSDYDARLLFEKGVRITNANALLYCAVKPSLSFIRKYIFLGGFLEGMRGFIISVFTAMAVFLNYAKLWELQQKNLGSQRELKRWR